MIPYETDPSLHAHAPQLPLLDDGFSPPSAASNAASAEHVPVEASPEAAQPPVDPSLWDKSDF